MEVESERLAKLILSNEADELIENQEFVKYITKIGSFNVEQLNEEPVRLKNEKNSILEQTQDLAFKNYKTFVQTAECCREIFTQFKDTEKRLDCLVNKIPELEKQCEKFAKTTRDINVNRRLNSLTLTRNAQLLEILELPQLMDSFIREEQYENALELTSYVRRLGVKHPEVSIFKSIVKDVEKSWLVMLHQLVEQLRLDLQLPRCLQIVGYLRRMEVFTEAELRLKFLHARDTWLQSSLAKIPQTDANYHLNKTIEKTRINLFSIVTQYRSIFNDDEHCVVNAGRNRQVHENVIFYSWLFEKISVFLHTLRLDLKRGVQSIDSILSQCMYFGLSFSRVGCDFRGLMAPIFIETISETFNKNIEQTTRNFERNMERFTLINKKGASAIWKNQQESSEDSLHPPENLLEFYPLAEYCNQILTLFNELKLCAPFAVVSEVTKGIQESLSVVSKTILIFYGQEQQAFTVPAREAFVRLCTCFSDDLIPYLQRCLHVLYPPSSVAQHLGISIQQLNKDGLLQLNRNEVIQPIAHLLPVKIEPVIEISDEVEKKDEVLVVEDVIDKKEHELES